MKDNPNSHGRIGGVTDDCLVSRSPVLIRASSKGIIDATPLPLPDGEAGKRPELAETIPMRSASLDVRESEGAADEARVELVERLLPTRERSPSWAKEAPEGAKTKAAAARLRE